MTLKFAGAFVACMFLSTVIASADPVAGNGSYGVQSVSAGTGVTITGTPQNPVINASGGGGGTISQINAGSNAVVTNPNGPTTTIGVNANPTFSNMTLTAGGQLLYGTPGAGDVSSAIRLGSSNNTYTNIQACPSGSSVATCVVNGITGTAFDLNNGSTAQFVFDTNSNASISGSFYSSQLTSGRCLQAATNGQISNAAQGCMTTSLNGTQQTGAQAPHIEQFNNTPTVANNGTRSYTFSTAFLTIPVCQVQQSAVGIAPTLGGNTGIWPSTISTTSVTITNDSGATQQPYVTCIGL